jgi:hypothetical protein
MEGMRRSDDRLHHITELQRRQKEDEIASQELWEEVGNEPWEHCFLLK